ncbi:hypothetical protein GN316_17045 [Xylophilus sp. Kf1]|nr:hypothetical protein [Xylophilus sp. Kf1]
MLTPPSIPTRSPVPTADRRAIPDRPGNADNGESGSPGDATGVVTTTPYLLTRLYEGKKAFLPEDQDTLGATFKPLVRVYAEPAGDPAPLTFSRLKKIGDPPKANGVGYFLDPLDGRQYYIKQPSTREHAINEVLFGNLARKFGLDVPQTQVLEQGDKIYVASAFIENLQLANALFPNCAIDPRELVKIPRACPAVGQALVVAALLNTRDIIGIGCDNLGFRTRPDGSLSPVFVDFGGSGAFRATAGRKPFTTEAQELSSMTEPEMQADDFGGGPNGLVFGNTPKSMLRESLDRVLSVPDADIRDEISRHITDPQAADRLFDTLIRRRDAIRAQIESGAVLRFQEKLESVVSYGIACAYGWDDEDDDITRRIRIELEPVLAEYLSDHMHLTADSTGQLEIGRYVETVVGPWIARLLQEKNPGSVRAGRPR